MNRFFVYILYLLVFNFLTVCRRIEAGTKVLFGPKPGITASYIKSVSKYLEIPLINIHHEIPFGSPDRQGISVSFFPHYLAVSRAHRDLIKFWGWKKFSMLYVDNDSKLFHIQCHAGIY